MARASLLSILRFFSAFFVGRLRESYCWSFCRLTQLLGRGSLCRVRVLRHDLPKTAWFVSSIFRCVSQVVAPTIAFLLFLGFDVDLAQRTKVPRVEPAHVAFDVANGLSSVG
jgi:hypothetical protein